MKEYKLAIVGATGLVGRTVIQVLEEKKLPIKEYVLFASKKSVRCDPTIPVTPVLNALVFINVSPSVHFEFFL